MRATIHERGNGLPDVGDYVAGNDGELYKVVSIDGRIMTGPSGSGMGSRVNATVELADWSDVDDDSEPSCTAVIEHPLADAMSTLRAHQYRCRDIGGEIIVYISDTDGALEEIRSLLSADVHCEQDEDGDIIVTEAEA